MNSKAIKDRMRIRTSADMRDVYIILKMDSKGLSLNPIFSGLKGEALSELLKGCKERQIQPGEVLFRAGDAPRAIFVVRMGSLKLLAPKRNSSEGIVIVGPGKLLGECGFLERSPHSATVIALETSGLLEMPYTYLENWGRLFSEAHLELIQSISLSIIHIFRQIPEDLSTLQSFKLRLQ